MINLGLAAGHDFGRIGMARGLSVESLRHRRQVAVHEGADGFRKAVVLGRKSYITCHFLEEGLALNGHGRHPVLK